MSARKRAQKKSRITEVSAVPFAKIICDTAPKRRLRQIARQIKRLGRHARPEDYDAPDLPPSYRLDIAGFERLVKSYREYVEAYEQYYRAGRSASVVRRIERTTFGARYSATLSKLVFPTQVDGQMIPLMNPIYFSGRSARRLFWKLAELAARRYRLESQLNPGGRPIGPGVESKRFLRAAQAQYRSEFESNLHESHAQLCIDVHAKLRRDGFSPPTPRTLENTLRALSRSLRPKR